MERLPCQPHDDPESMFDAACVQSQEVDFVIGSTTGRSRSGRPAARRSQPGRDGLRVQTLPAVLDGLRSLGWGQGTSENRFNFDDEQFISVQARIGDTLGKRSCRESAVIEVRPGDREVFGNCALASRPQHP